MPNDGTFGFNRPDANALLDLIATHDVEHEEIKPIGGGNGGGGVDVFEYVLSQDMSLNSSGYWSATGSVRNINSLGGSFASAIITDILGTAANQIASDRGIVAKIGSSPYVVIEPQCAFDDFSPSTGGGGSIPISTNIANPSSVSP